VQICFVLTHSKISRYTLNEVVKQAEHWEVRGAGKFASVARIKLEWGYKS